MAWIVVCKLCKQLIKLLSIRSVLSIFFLSQVPNNIQRDNAMLNLRYTTDKDKSAKPNHLEITETLKQQSLWLPEFVQQESQIRLCAITISIHLDQSILSTTCSHQVPAIWEHPGDAKKGRKKNTKWQKPVIDEKKGERWRRERVV